ncbi:MAG TPA: ThiF family adenylyltransferase [Methanomassiliicoccales archaeon]|nr:ThiF family adenylyltransferase [Methanomassiliicoccales archaeon]
MVDEDRLDRSRRIAWLDVDRVIAAKVMVIGAGALGNEVVKNLVLSGFRKITLVDMDHVVRSNLNRCVFFGEDDATGKSMKAQVVARNASRMDPDVDIVPIVGKVEELDEGLLKEHDLVFGCLDNIMARLHLNAHSYFAGIPYIDGGTDGFSGKVQAVLPPSTPCLQCAMNRSHYKVLQKRFSCTGADVVYHERKMPAEITTTSVVAAIQVREGLKVVSGSEDKVIRNVVFYNGLENRYETFELDIDPECPNHMPIRSPQLS